MPARPIRILVVASADSPLLCERVLIPIKAGHDVVWFSESARPPDRLCKTIHAPKFNRLDLVGRLITIGLFWITYFKMRPDIVHVHWANFPALLFKARWRNLIVSPMGSDIFLPGRWDLRKRISRGVLQRAKCATSKSPYMDRKLEALGVPGEMIERITWGIASEFFRLRERRTAARRTLGIETERCVFFSPRAHKPIYRIDRIVEAFVAFIQEGGEGKLLVAEMYGDRATRAHLLSLIPEAGIRKRVAFLGTLEAHQMRLCYAAADVVVSFAATDGMPQTLYEAMAAGCFPVFSDLPQYDCLLVHGENCFLCHDTGERSIETGLAYAERTVAAQWDPEPNRQLVERIASRAREGERMNAIYRRVACN